MSQPEGPSAKTSAQAPAAALSRRTLFAGAGAAGALATVAAVLPQATVPAAVASAVPAAPAADGYQLTEHVQRYYQTARV